MFKIKFNMKLLFVLVVVFVSCTLVKSDTKYDSKFDSVDLDEILKSDRLLKNYIKCLLSEGSCTPDGQELKKTLPDATATDCAKCTESQKKGADKVLEFMLKNKPVEYEKLEKVYDKEGVFRKKYLAKQATA